MNISTVVKVIQYVFWIGIPRSYFVGPGIRVEYILTSYHWNVNAHSQSIILNSNAIYVLEIEANMSLKAEWDTIQEAGEKLTPLFGPGYTGMVNLGNSCIPQKKALYSSKWIYFWNWKDFCNESLWDKNSASGSLWVTL